MPHIRSYADCIQEPMYQRSGPHQPWVYGETDRTTEWVPYGRVKPVVERHRAVLNQVLRGAVVEISAVGYISHELSGSWSGSYGSNSWIIVSNLMIGCSRATNAAARNSVSWCGEEERSHQECKSRPVSWCEAAAAGSLVWFGRCAHLPDPTPSALDPSHFTILRVSMRRQESGRLLCCSCTR